jgi:transcriptional regulator with XRE-family HTH domain
MADQLSREEFGRRLKLARTNAGFDLVFVCNDLKIPFGQLNDAEKGIGSISTLQLKKLSELYAIPFEWIFRESGEL